VADEIGRGSFGQVFRISRGDEERALKVLHLGYKRQVERENGNDRVASATERLQRDWRHVERYHAEIDCDAVVRVFETARVDRKAELDSAESYGLIAMELYKGNLHDFALDHSPMSPSLLREVLRRVAAALGEVEKRGWIYEDIKPENFLVRPAGEAPPRIVIGDIGGLKRLRSGSSTAQQTLEYQAPEAIVEGVDAAPTVVKTVWSFGMLGFFLIEGRVAYAEYGVTGMPRVWASIREKGPDWRMDLSPGYGPFKALINSCLQFDPAKRPQSFDEIISRLRQGQGGTIDLKGAAVGVSKLGAQPIRWRRLSEDYIKWEGERVSTDQVMWSNWAEAALVPGIDGAALLECGAAANISYFGHIENEDRKVLLGPGDIPGLIAAGRTEEIRRLLETERVMMSKDYRALRLFCVDRDLRRARREVDIAHEEQQGGIIPGLILAQWYGEVDKGKAYIDEIADELLSGKKTDLNSNQTIALMCSASAIARQIEGYWDWRVSGSS